MNAQETGGDVDGREGGGGTGEHTDSVRVGFMVRPVSGVRLPVWAWGWGASPGFPGATFRESVPEERLRGTFPEDAHGSRVSRRTRL